MLCDIRDIHVSFEKPVTGWFRSERQPVLRDVSFQLEQGECLGLIGESGSGKSTLGQVMLGNLPSLSGQVLFNGHNLYPDGKRRATRV